MFHHEFMTILSIAVESNLYKKYRIYFSRPLSNNNRGWVAPTSIPSISQTWGTSWQGGGLLLGQCHAVQMPVYARTGEAGPQKDLTAGKVIIEITKSKAQISTVQNSLQPKKEVWRWWTQRKESSWRKKELQSTNGEKFVQIWLWQQLPK